MFFNDAGTILVRFCSVAWVLFSVFLIFCISHLVIASVCNTKKPLHKVSYHGFSQYLNFLTERLVFLHQISTQLRSKGQNAMQLNQSENYFYERQ